MDCLAATAAGTLPEGTFELLDELHAVHAAHTQHGSSHILTGPVRVKGAMPGDVLEVRIKDIRLRANWGHNVMRPLMGTLPEDFPLYRMIEIPIDKQARIAKLPWGKDLPLSPFFGVMGTAPPPVYGRIPSGPPREHGGNLDNKELLPGSILYLPVWVEGANFSAGDGHGVQGDGEVCISALETALAGSFELHLRKDMDLAVPRAETPTHWITMAFNSDLDDAAKDALRRMIAFIVETAGLSREDAYSLCSLACDMRITQLVNGEKGVHAMLAKSAL
jgi:acetamidase/formamidase